MTPKLLYNCNIHTFDTAQPFASAMLIENGTITAIGYSPETLDKPGTEKFNLDGADIIPGLVDGHIHTMQYALNIEKIDCETQTRQACLEKVAEKARNVPKNQWILGHGWNHNLWDEGIGDVKLLDEIAPNNPVFLTAKSLHAAWCNSEALRRAHITKQRDNPPDGVIDHFPDGSPTGILYESAIRLVQDILPAPTFDEIISSIRKAQGTLLSYGITGIHDFDGEVAFRAFQNLDRNHKLELRVVKNIPNDFLDAAIELGMETGFGNEHLSIGSVKLFADGALGTQTAALIAPYENQPKNKGLLLLDADSILEIGKKASLHRLPLAIHAIGDRAVHEVLTGLLRLHQFENRNNMPPLRHRIEHMQLLNPNDLHLLSAFPFTASMQPIHAASDRIMAERYWGSRIAGAYPWKSILTHGNSTINLAFGSDAPVESPNPFPGIYAAITRNWPSPNTNRLFTEQRIRLQDAFFAYTKGCRFASGKENRLGKLLPGFFADLVVLEKGFFSLPPETIRNSKPVQTMINGNWVFSS